MRSQIVAAMALFSASLISGFAFGCGDKAMTVDAANIQSPAYCAAIGNGQACMQEVVMMKTMTRSQDSKCPGEEGSCGQYNPDTGANCAWTEVPCGDSGGKVTCVPSAKCQ